MSELVSLQNHELKLVRRFFQFLRELVVPLAELGLLELGPAVQPEVVPLAANGLKKGSKLGLVIVDLDFSQLLVVVVGLHLEIQDFQALASLRVPFELLLSLRLHTLKVGQ